MAKFEQLIEDRKQAAAEEAQANKLPEWKELAQTALDSTKEELSHETVNTVAARIAAGGYPKNLTLGGCCITVVDEKDLAKFWATVYSNLPKAKLAEIKENGIAELGEYDISRALYRYQQHAGIAKRLNEAGIAEEAIEFTADDCEYIAADGMVIDLCGNVVADISDIQKPYGPDEWAEISKRILVDDEQDYEEEEDEDY